jgi:hypothetical protein
MSAALLGHEQQWCSSLSVETDGQHLHVLHACLLTSRAEFFPVSLRGMTSFL